MPPIPQSLQAALRTEIAAAGGREVSFVAQVGQDGEITAVRARAGSHACCEHRAPTRGERSQTPFPHVPAGGDNSDCPHCGTGAAALERPDASHVTTLHPAGPGLFTSDSAPIAAGHVFDSHSHFAPLLSPIPRASSTLLGLHCALNR